MRCKAPGVIAADPVRETTRWNVTSRAGDPRSADQGRRPYRASVEVKVGVALQTRPVTRKLDV